MKGFFQNLFLPHSGNNYRSKLLHPQILVLIITFLFAAFLILPVFSSTLPEVLGISSDISTEELLTLTNQKRQENGLSPLQFNEELSIAAKLKAQDMFSKDYWAHNAPDGITPWVFIKKSGYEYRYAGENLAKGFTVSKDIIAAWMASTSHRENMLSTNYEDIGFAFMEGKLHGQETILVVEMFGNKHTSMIATQPTEQSLLSSSQNVLASIKNTPFISNSVLSYGIAFLILFLFIFTFIFDMIITEKRKIARFVGHNIDHIFFLGMVIVVVMVIRSGVIL